jgi:Zn-dependent membrane protease YugP
MSATHLLLSLLDLMTEKKCPAWLNSTKITNKEEFSKAKDALKLAAIAYVVAALAAFQPFIIYYDLSGKQGQKLTHVS